MSGPVSHFRIAPPGPQHSWEALRTIGKGTDLLRRKRLKALGNAQVPANVELIARAILDADGRAAAWTRAQEEHR